MSYSEEQLEAARTAYLRNSYPGDLAEVIESKVTEPVTSASTARSPIRRGRFLQGTITISFIVVAAVVVGMFSRIPDPPAGQEVTRSNSANNGSAVTIDTPRTARRKASSQRYRLFRAPSTQRLSANRKRLRVFNPPSELPGSKKRTAARSTSATRRFNLSGRKGVVTSGWRGARLTRLSTQRSNVHQSRSSRRRNHRSRQPRKRVYHSHRFQYDPISINKYRSS